MRRKVKGDCFNPAILLESSDLGRTIYNFGLAVQLEIAEIRPVLFGFEFVTVLLKEGMFMVRRFVLMLLGVIFIPVVSLCGAATVRKEPYHGWNEALIVSNGKVEAVVVPAIGRVMQFRFAGENDGPFWENRLLDGKAPDSQSSEWGNFGGDKSWPAPQGEWEKMTGRGWPPPAAFDSMAVKAEWAGDEIVLRTAIDAQYGIEEERRIKLHATSAEMSIVTTYRKKKGGAVRVSVWTITQFKDPEVVYMPLPEKSIFPTGYNKQSKGLPLGLALENGLVSCRRSPTESTKIGSDAGQLIWVGQDQLCEVFAPRESSGEFPDNNSSAEIYTNADPLKYVELELLGPLKSLAAGETLSRTQTYRLFRRESGPVLK